MLFFLPYGFQLQLLYRLKLMFPISPTCTESENSPGSYGYLLTEEPGFVFTRNLRRQLRRVRRAVHFAAATERERIDSVPRVQKARAQAPLDFQFTRQTQTAFGFRREESRLHCFEAREQGRIRAAVIK